jgi:2',3'-cyclic-nucleotide 2'-phosphodiesterase/3'-nucleotidase
MDAVRLLVTSDTHGGVSHPFADGCALPRLGASPAARKGQPTLLLDNGNTFYGGSLVDMLAERADEAHVIARCFSLLGYDALNLGNEDLKLGLNRLAGLAKAHSLPLVTTNVAVPQDVGIPASRTVSLPLTSGGSLKRGLLGTVAASACRGANLPKIGTSRPALAREIARLKARGCDAIIVMCHTGIRKGNGFPHEEAEALSVASLPGISVVVAGHLHERDVVWTAGGVPVVAPGAYARHFGIIDLEVQRAHGAVRMVCARASVEAVEHTRADPQLERLVAPALLAMHTQHEAVLGETRVRLTTDFALLVKPTAVQWMEACPRRQVAELTGRDDVIVATQCSGGRGPLAWMTIPAGLVRSGDVTRIFPYNNALQLAEVTGETLVGLIENSTAAFHPIEPGEAAWQPLLDESVPLCDHDYFSEIEYVIDLRRTVGRRTRDVRWRGQAGAPAGHYLLESNDYRLARLARAWPLSDIHTIAPSVGRALASGVGVQLSIDDSSTPRFLPLTSSPPVYFRARAPATSRPPRGIRPLLDTALTSRSAALYAFEDSRSDDP